MPGMFDHKERAGDKRNWTQSSWAKPTRSGVYGKNKGRCIFEPPSRLINQELQDGNTHESAGYLPRHATVKVVFVTGK